MRIIDPNEIPSAENASEYPYDEIAAVVVNGQAVELDPADYSVTTNQLRSALEAHRRRHGRPWRVMQRRGLVYVEGRTP